MDCPLVNPIKPFVLVSRGSHLSDFRAVGFFDLLIGNGHISHIGVGMQIHKYRCDGVFGQGGVEVARRSRWACSPELRKPEPIGVDAEANFVAVVSDLVVVEAQACPMEEQGNKDGHYSGNK